MVSSSPNVASMRWTGEFFQPNVSSHQLAFRLSGSRAGKPSSGDSLRKSARAECRMRAPVKARRSSIAHWRLL